MRVYFTDEDGHVVDLCSAKSELFASTASAADANEWKKLAVELSADAREVLPVIELGLFQPSQYSTKPHLPGAPFPQDIRGSAWFDDISVSQVPRFR